MTIFTKIVNNRILNLKHKLETYTDLWPEVIANNMKEAIAQLETDPVTYFEKMKGLDEFGQIEVIGKEEIKTGSGGKKYVQFNTAEGLINYFPNARFGSFIAKNKSKKELTDGK